MFVSAVSIPVTPVTFTLGGSVVTADADTDGWKEPDGKSDTDGWKEPDGKSEGIDEGAGKADAATDG